MTEIAISSDLDIIAISARAQSIRESFLESSASENEARDQYLQALKALVGHKVVASYKFDGILIGRESHPPRPPHPQYTRLGHPVVRTEVEVVIDKVQVYDGSVYMRFPEGINGTSLVAEQAGVDTLVIHDIVEL